MSDYPGRIGGFVGDALRQARDRAMTDVFGDGFNQAADIALRTVETKIDALMDRIEQGQALTPEEQALLAGLNRLKAELDGEFRRFWEDVAANDQR
jgi:hypothetical protein